MADFNKSTAPPYEEAAPYNNAPYNSAPPAQPMMHQDTGYPHDPYGYSGFQQNAQSNVPNLQPQPDIQYGYSGSQQNAQSNVPNPQPQPDIQHAAMNSPPAHTDQKGSFYGAGQQQQQQGVPMQNVPHPQGQYAIATPLPNLGEGAAPVDCPACRERHLTRTEYVSGNTAMAWAGLLCICCWLGCIPFMMRSLKDVEHHCGKCGAMLATWHNSGRTVVHVHG